MTLLPRLRIGVGARHGAVRAGLEGILSPHYEVVAAGEDADANVYDLDAWEDIPTLPTLVLTDFPSIARRLAALRPPGWGAIRREADGDAVLAALRCVLEGQVVCEADWLAGLAQPISELSADLSPREHQVLQLMAIGLANKEIATKLGLSVHTVKFHAASLLGKLGAASRTEAVTHALRRGLVTL
jgi:two-component system, NarL family, nitrate/nitrite response regulator NarL